MREWWARLRGTFGGSPGDLHEEIETHLAMALEEEGDEARRRFGNRAAIEERAWEAWSFDGLETLLRDLRYGARMLRRSRAFTAVAVLSLALGIGVNTAIFSVMDALMLRTLPVRNPEQLVRLASPGYFGFSHPLFERFRAMREPFSGVSAIAITERSNVAVNGSGGGTEPGPLQVGLVSGDYFATLGLGSALGRLFSASDDVAPGGHPVAVISYGYWERRFGLDPAVLGRTLRINNVDYAVIGVTPRGFSGDYVGTSTDLWLPLAMWGLVVPESPEPSTSQSPFGRLRIVARVRPDVAVERAQAAAQVVFFQAVSSLAASAGAEVAESWRRHPVVLEPAARGLQMRRTALAQPLAILMTGAGLVLLIACANVATLLLGRSAARRREIAVRMALGAGRLRIVRQLLTESTLLAVIGCAMGLALGAWGAGLLVRFAGSGLETFSLDLHADWRVAVFALACLFTGVVFGLAPAMRSSQGLAGRSGAGQLLVVLQVGLSLAVLIGAGLFVRTLRNLKSQDLGFDREHILLIWTAPEQAGRSGRAVAPLFAALPPRIERLPGVTSASASLIGLLAGEYAEDAPASATPSGDCAAGFPNLVSPGYFRSAGMALLGGRDFDARDTGTSPAVGIINEALARYCFGGGNPIGRHFLYRRSAVEIVGVARDAKYNSLREGGRRLFYIPYSQDTAHLFEMCLVVRTARPGAAMAARIREEIRAFDPNLPVLRIDTVEEQIDRSLLEERLIALLSTLFGGLALLLACLGLYGVMSYCVSRRYREIGVRMALGATRGAVVGMVLESGLRMVLAGIALGVPAALGATRLVAARLFGVSPGDPLTIGAACLLLAGVAAIAAFLPARRASKVDPMAALRYE